MLIPSSLLFLGLFRLSIFSPQYMLYFPVSLHAWWFFMVCKTLQIVPYWVLEVFLFLWTFSSLFWDSVKLLTNSLVLLGLVLSFAKSSLISLWLILFFHWDRTCLSPLHNAPWVIRVFLCLSVVLLCLAETEISPHLWTLDFSFWFFQLSTSLISDSFLVHMHNQYWAEKSKELLKVIRSSFSMKFPPRWYFLSVNSRQLGLTRSLPNIFSTQSLGFFSMHHNKKLSRQ